MAGVTLGVQTPSTSNVTSYASGSFTPAASDLLIAVVTATDTVATGTMTDSQSLGFTKIAGQTYNSAADSIYVFRANALAAASSMTVTFDCTGDAATGATVCVFRIANADGVYVRAVGTGSGAASTTPTVALPQAVDSRNAVIGACGNGANPAALTPPASWSELGDTGYGTPPSGQEAASRNSGETLASIAWGGTSGTAWGAAVVEISTDGETLQPSTPVLDNFNRADGDTGANWTTDPFAVGAIGFNVSSNQAVPSATSPDAEDYWNPATFGGNWEVYLTIATKPADTQYCGLEWLTTLGSGNVDGYFCQFSAVAGASNDTTQLFREDNSTPTQIGSTATQEFASGDKLMMARRGSNVVVHRYNSATSTWVQLISVSDTNYTGSGNLAMFAVNTTVRLDDFGGGETPVIGQTVPQIARPNAVYDSWRPTIT